MIRPITTVSLPFCLGVLTSTVWDIGWLSPVLAGGVVVIFLHKSTRKTLWLAIGFLLLGFVVGVSFENDYRANVEHLRMHSNVHLYGEVVSVEAGEEGTKLVIKNWSSFDGYRGSGRIVLYTQVEQCVPGDLIEVEGVFQSGRKATNEGGFNQQGYYKSTNVLGHIYVEQINIYQHKLSLNAFIQRLHQSRVQAIEAAMPSPYDDLATTFLLGDALENEAIQENMATAGLLHVLAISGLHIGLVVMLLELIIPNHHISVKSMMILVMIWMYIFLIGCPVSALRAGLMLSIYLGADVLRRKYDPISALMGAGMLMLFMAPWFVYSIGFLLSIGAVASMVWLQPWVVRKLPNKLWFKQEIGIMLSVNIGLSPILLHYFYVLPVYGLVANLLILPMIPWILVVGFMWLLLEPLGHFFTDMLTGGLYYGLHYVMAIGSGLSNMPLNTLYLGSIPLWLMVVYYLALFMMISLNNIKLERTIIIALGLSLVVWVAWPTPTHFTMLDVGNGDSFVWQTSIGQTFLMDGGGKKMGNNEPGKKDVGYYDLLPYLRYHGVSHIDGIFISHGDYDHIYGIMELVDYMPVQGVYLSEIALETMEEGGLLSQLLDLCIEKDIPYFSLVVGDVVQFYDGRLKVIGPNKDYGNSNDNSMVCLLTLRDFTGLLCGDISQSQEKVLLQEEQLDALNYVKVAHHGSKSSSYEGFVAYAAPELALISVGQDNPYGHPNEQVVELWKTYSGAVYMTSEHGQVDVVFRDDQMRIYK